MLRYFFKLSILIVPTLALAQQDYRNYNPRSTYTEAIMMSAEDAKKWDNLSVSSDQKPTTGIRILSHPVDRQYISFWKCTSMNPTYRLTMAPQERCAPLSFGQNDDYPLYFDSNTTNRLVFFNIRELKELDDTVTTAIRKNEEGIHTLTFIGTTIVSFILFKRAAFGVEASAGEAGVYQNVGVKLIGSTLYEPTVLAMSFVIPMLGDKSIDDGIEYAKGNNSLEFIERNDVEMEEHVPAYVVLVEGETVDGFVTQLNRALTKNLEFFFANYSYNVEMKHMGWMLNIKSSMIPTTTKPAKEH